MPSPRDSVILTSPLMLFDLHVDLFDRVGDRVAGLTDGVVELSGDPLPELLLGLIILLLVEAEAVDDRLEVGLGIMRVDVWVDVDGVPEDLVEVEFFEGVGDLLLGGQDAGNEGELTSSDGRG